MTELLYIYKDVVLAIVVTFLSSIHEPATALHSSLITFFPI